MDLLDVGVATDDILHPVEILAALVHDEVGTVVREGGREFERHARTGEEVLDRDFFRTLAIACTGATGGGTTEGAGGTTTRGSTGATTGAEASHLQHGRRGERVDFGLEEAVAGVFADFDDTTGADSEAKADALTGVIKSLIDGDVAELEADRRILVGRVDEDDVHALLILVVGSGLSLQQDERAVERLVADEEALGELDGLHLLDHRVVTVGGVDLDVFAVEDFGELPGLVEELEELALGHATVPLAGIFRQHLTDANLVGLGFGVVGLVLEDFAVGIEGTLIVAVKVAGTAPDEQLVDLVVLDPKAGGSLVDIAVGRIVPLGGKFLLQADDSGVIIALEFGVLGDDRGGLDHIAGFDGDKGAAGEGGALGFLDALFEAGVGKAGGTESAIRHIEVGQSLVDGLSRSLTDQAFGRRNHVSLLADRVGVGAGEAINFGLGSGRAAGIAGDTDFLFSEGDGVAKSLGGRGGVLGEGTSGDVKLFEGTLVVASGTLLTSVFDDFADLGEELLIRSGFVGRDDGGIRLRGVGGLLGGFGFRDIGGDVLEAFGRAEILGVDGEDRLVLGLGGLQVAFIAGLQRLGEELRLACGGIAILGDKRAGGESQSESGPGELRTVEIFHGVVALKIIAWGWLP